MEDQNVIQKLSIEFALDIIVFAEELEAKNKFVIARQILKSGTSIGANIHEAQNAESKIDFIHKITIAAKEMEETEYWLMLCKHSPSYPFEETLMEKLKSIQRIIGKIIVTAKR